MTDRAFDAWVADARAVRIVEELSRRGHAARLRRSGPELCGPCPLCGGTDRFAVNLSKNIFNCRGCGRGGGPIDFVEMVDGASFLVACETLTGSAPPGQDGGESEADRAARLQRLAEATAARAREDATRDGKQAEYRDRERVRAHEIWQKAGPIGGTTGERYLGLRGLAVPAGAHLRFLPNHGLWSRPPPDGKIVHRGPVLVAAIVGPDGRFGGVHLTWIDLADPDGKVRVPNADGKFVPAKKIRGSHSGGSILLAPCPAGRQPRLLYLGEGIETVLSVRQALAAIDAPELAEAEFRSAVSLGNIAGRAKGRVAHPADTIVDKRGRTRRRMVPDAVPLPGDTKPVVSIGATIRDVVLLGDGDSDAFTTGLDLRRGAARLARAYPWISVGLAMAPEGQDFNDAWRAALVTEVVA